MSEIILNKKAYINNIKQVSDAIGGVEKIILIVKDNAYGHDAKLISKLASQLGIKKAATKSIKEAVQLANFYDEILVLSHIPNGQEDKRFIYGINDIKDIPKYKNNTNVHIAVDTLMHRNGILPEDIIKSIKLCKDYNLNLKGLYTHFRSSDEIGSDFFVQREIFENVKKISKVEAKKFGFDNLIFHSCNSAAIERSFSIDDDFVRLGIAQFGYCQFNNKLKLEKVLKLYANKVSSRILKKGQKLGYGGTFEANRDINIATYDIGYGDGLFRYNGHGNFKLPNGMNILGKMSMDSFSCEDCGDKICVLDDANTWADFFNTICYEILVKLSPEIPRKWI